MSNLHQNNEIAYEENFIQRRICNSKKDIYWKCNSCKNKTSIFKGKLSNVFSYYYLFFKGSVFFDKNLEIKEVLFLLKLWTRNFEAKNILFLFNDILDNSRKITIPTIYTYFQFFRQLVSKYLSNYIPVLSFKGEVEIDEMQLGSKPKRPNNHVRPCRDRNLIFGIISRENGKFLLFKVQNRKKETLWPIIEEYIDEESTVYSDKMASYVNTRTNESHLEGLGFKHFWVNHSEGFIDPLFRHIHTNKIERLWRSLRAHVSHIHRSIKEENVDSFLDTFMVKCFYGEEEFYDVMMHIFCTIANDNNYHE